MREISIWLTQISSKASDLADMNFTVGFVCFGCKALYCKLCIAALQ